MRIRPGSPAAITVQVRIFLALADIGKILIDQDRDIVRSQIQQPKRGIVEHIDKRLRIAGALLDLACQPEPGGILKTAFDNRVDEHRQAELDNTHQNSNQNRCHHGQFHGGRPGFVPREGSYDLAF